MSSASQELRFGNCLLPGSSLITREGDMELQPHDPGNMVLILPLCEANSVFLGHNHCMWLGQTGGTQLDSHVMMLI